MFEAYASGFGLGSGLIVAIGAQNAFVLRQGLLRRHVFASAAICALSDAALIAAGAAGFGALVAATPWLRHVAAFGGAAFLIWYGLRAARAALNPAALTLEETRRAPGGLKAALLTVLALTWLNPHVYLDTVVLLGGIAGQYAADARVWFAVGAMSASVVWFFGLGYGARLLAPLFAQPKAWRALDGLIALVMWTIAGSLLWDYVEGWA